VSSRAAGGALVGLLGRILSATVLLAVVVGVIFAVLLVAISELRDSAADVRRSSEVLASANALQRRVVDLETGVRGYLITRERRFLEPFDAARASAPPQARQLVMLAPEDSMQRARAASLRADLDGYLSDFALPVIRRIERGRLRSPETVVNEDKRRVDGMRAIFGRFIGVQEGIAERRRSEAEDNARAAVVVGIVGLVASVLLVLAFAGYLSRAAVSPIRRVVAGARRLATGDLSSRVQESGSAEAAELGRSFNAMAGALESGRDELETQNAELEAQQSELEHTVEALAGEKTQIEVLHRFGQRLTDEVQLEPLAKSVLSALCEVARADVGALYARARVERAGDGATLLAQRGLDPARLPRRVRAGEGLAGRALGERRTLAVRHGGGDLRVPAWGDAVAAHAEVHVPLRQSDRHVGVVSLARLADDPFGVEEIETLEILTAQAAIALSNARALQVARHQARQFRAVVDTARDAFVAADEDGRIVQWNPQAEALLGWRRDEAVGRAWVELLAPERDRPGYERWREAFLARGEDETIDQPIEATVVHRDGRELPIEALVSPLESDGRWVFNVFVRDISERLRALVYERTQNAVNRVLAEATSLEDAQPRLLEAVGGSLDWPQGVLWRLDDQSRELRLVTTWSAGDADGAEMPAQGLPLRALDTEGPVWDEHALAFPLASDGRVLGVMGFTAQRVVAPDAPMLALLRALARQIGQYVERKESEREAERLKDQFFALVSHELRTPLTSIIGYLELVLEEPDDLPERDRRFLAVVDRNAKRLLRLVGDLLFVAHVEAGRLALEVGRVDLRALTEESVEAARPRAQGKDLTFEVQADDLPPIAGDRDRLAQVLDNLIGNAIKFTPDDGRVSVHLHESAGEAVLEVQDTGVGIPTGEQSRLFERFFRASTATDRAIPGVGLGLTIAKAIVEAHGGTIEVSSAEGAGTTFRVHVPLDRPATITAPSAGSTGYELAS